MNEAHESQFDQFGQLILGKPRRPSRLNHFDPIEVSGGLNRKLAGLAGGSPRFAYPMGPHSAEATQKSWEVKLFWHHAPLSSFHRHERSLASNSVSSFSSIHPWFDMTLTPFSLYTPRFTFAPPKRTSSIFSCDTRLV